MSKISTSDFQKGMFIEFREEPYQIVEFKHVNPGKGSAFVRTKLKALKSEKVLEFTYKSGESVEEIPIFVKEMQYLYKDKDGFTFMDNKSYEQLNLSETIVGNFKNYIKEGQIYQILIHNDQAVGMHYPKKVSLAVIESDEGAKGNTVTGAKKVVIIETGAKVTVPLFIKKGDTIAIDPESGNYLERSSK